MQDISTSTFIISSETHLARIRNQGALSPFTEKPSDEHNEHDAEAGDETAHLRLSASDLFSMFTANIITARVIFVR